MGPGPEHHFFVVCVPFGSLSDRHSLLLTLGLSVVVQQEKNL